MLEKLEVNTNEDFMIFPNSLVFMIIMFIQTYVQKDKHEEMIKQIYMPLQQNINNI